MNSNTKIKVHHNKIRNTGVLFESLARQVTVDVLNDKSSSTASGIIKQFFNKKTELRKELNLYHALVKNKFTNEVKASNFVDIIIEERKKITSKILAKEKYEIIKKLKESFSIDQLFSSRVDHYPVYASIYKVFQYNNVLNEVSNPEDLVNAKFKIIEHLTKPEVTKAKKQDTETILSKETMPIRLLTQEIIINGFNAKFSNKLSVKQKGLIRDYINSISNTNSLSESLSKKIPLIIEDLKSLIDIIPDDAIRIKLDEVKNQISKITNYKNISDSKILGILRIYDLINDIKEHIRKNRCAQTLTENK